MNTNEPVRVLYVEDDPDSFEMLRMMLGLSQIDLERAANVSEAFTRAGSERFDLYLLDTDLPDGSGISLCRTLRAIDPQIPVVFYSGNAHTEQIRSGLAAGASGYITKPNSDKLAATIHRLLTVHREQHPAFTDFRVLSTAA